MKKLLFLTLNTFSATGGIEKVCRVAGMALHQICSKKKDSLEILSLYDRGDEINEKYFPANIYRGFSAKKISFILAAVRSGIVSHSVVLSHINLLGIGYLIKKISPRTKLILIAHGIEVWQPLSASGKRMLNAVDLFLPVSRFTGTQLETKLSIPRIKIDVLNNCLDPFLTKAVDQTKERSLRTKFGINSNDVVLLTLTRLKYSEQYKGYDEVIAALSNIKQQIPTVKYLIAGRYDKEEKTRLDVLIQSTGLEDIIIFAGFVAEDDIESLFNISDVYIMPSTGEGFGIVFIEALFYGKPVVAGNKDGSVDALANGEFGILIDPNNQQEIIDAVLKISNNKSSFTPDEKKVMEKFGFPNYKAGWQRILFQNSSAAAQKMEELSEVH